MTDRITAPLFCFIKNHINHKSPIRNKTAPISKSTIVFYGKWFSNVSNESIITNYLQRFRESFALSIWRL